VTDLPRVYVVQCTVGGVTFPACVCMTEVEATAVAVRMADVATRAITGSQTILERLTTTVRPPEFTVHDVPLADIGGEFERQWAALTQQHVRRAMDLGGDKK
jgi:hypothetical protein